MIDNTPVAPVLCLAAAPSQTRVAADWLAALGEQFSPPAAKLMQLDLCLDEVLMNIIMHSGLDAEAEPICLTFQVDETDGGRRALLTVRDAGVPFNLLASQPKQKATSLDEAEIGGLGLTIIQANAEHLDYVFDNGRNHLTFGVSWQPD